MKPHMSSASARRFIRDMASKYQHMQPQPTRWLTLPAKPRCRCVQCLRRLS